MHRGGTAPLAGRGLGAVLRRVERLLQPRERLLKAVELHAGRLAPLGRALFFFECVLRWRKRGQGL